MVGIVLQKARFVCLFSVFVGGLTFFGQSSRLKVFFFFFYFVCVCVCVCVCKTLWVSSLLEVFLEGSDSFFKGRV